MLKGFEKVAAGPVTKALSSAGKAIGRAGSATAKATDATGKAVGAVVGKGLGYVAAGTQKTRKGVKATLKGGKESFTKSYEAETRPGRERGRTLAKVRKLKKTQEATKGNLRDAGKKTKEKDVSSARGDAMKRLKVMKAGKPGFAEKHPIITAGLAYGGMRAAFGGESKKEEDPYVNVPRG